MTMLHKHARPNIAVYVRLVTSRDGNYLLPRREQIDVNGIETSLSACSSSKEQSINISDVSIRIYEQRAKERHGYYIYI